jgi:hypothetical protein
MILEFGLIAVAVTTGLPIGWKMFHTCWEKNVIRSRLTRLTSKRFSRKPEVLRSMFRDTPIDELDTAKNHTHGVSANHRSRASHFAATFAELLGYEPFYLQRSRADERNGRLGSREFYWVKDLTSEPSSLRRRSDQLLILIDVDEYLDMPNILGELMQPVLLYTFQPKSVACETGEYSFTFDENNCVKYIVNGGATYHHKVWNYKSDSILVEVYKMGILVRAVAYLVDKRQIDEHHQMILFSPIERWLFPFSYWTFLLEGERLNHLEVVNNGFLELTVKGPDTMVTSIGKVGCFTSCNVDRSKFEHLISIHRTSKIGLTHMQVKSVLQVEDIKCYFSALLLDFIRTCEPRLELAFSADFVRSYQFKNIYYDEEAPPAMVSFMKPVVDGAFVPVRSRANDYQLIKSRIINVRSTVTMNVFALKCAKEFIVLCGAKGQFSPVDLDIVYDRQKRPTQRRILNEADFCVPKHINKLFMKKEAYGNVNDPRPISTINGVTKASYSRYTYALDDLLKSQPWYAFGTAPRGVCARVADICLNAKNVGVTDYSRWDGHLSPALRTFEQMFMLACFRKEYHDELIQLMSKQYRLLSTLGEFSWMGAFERLSGSPETSCFNTVDNAFIAYCYKRSEKMSIEQAWSELGIYGGDDGLTPNVKPSGYQRLASRLGQKLDIQMIDKGSSGIKFLNRFYGPYVWYGDPNSCCDINRAISKFHTTVNMTFLITPEQKLMDKAYAYWLSDRNTPLIGEFVTAVCGYLPYDYTFKNLSGIYSAQYFESEQYVNLQAEWMMDVYIDQLPCEALETLFMWLHDVHNIKDMLSPPTIVYVEPQPHKTKTVVVDDSMISNRHKSGIKKKKGFKVSPSKGERVVPTAPKPSKLIKVAKNLS